MKILIDSRFLGLEGAGIGKYVDKLLSNLSEFDRENEYIVLLRKANFHLFNPSGENFKKLLVDAHWYSVKEQVLIPPILYKEKPDIIHFPHFNVPLVWKGRFVVTIHDLMISRFWREIIKGRFSPMKQIKKLVYQATLRKAARASQKILTPSEATKKELVKVFKIPKDKVIVTYEAADDIFVEYGKMDISEGEKKKVLATYGIKEPFILTVGNSYPYKNIKVVLEALERFSKNVHLVHVTKRDSFSEDLISYSKELGVVNRFVLTGQVPTEDLAVFYKSAEALVFPSLSEGFGLPGLEAMAAGCPVVCSNIEVFKEVYGDAASYFDPTNAKDIAEKIKLITNNSKLRTQNIKKGKEQAKKYSWRKLAQQTLEVYNSTFSAL